MLVFKVSDTIELSMVPKHFFRQNLLTTRSSLVVMFCISANNFHQEQKYMALFQQTIPLIRGGRMALFLQPATLIRDG